MDFFSAGGFQQLFSDLDEQLDMPIESVVYHIDINNPDSYYQQLETNLDETYNSSNSDSSSSDVTPTNFQYENLNTLNANTKDTFQYLENNNDYNNNNNNNSNNNASENLNQQLENCLDYLLPINNDVDILDNIEFPGVTTETSCLIQEVAEWEAQFLDNYIEIPELVDFLPEKTPLCTDTCELFLQESSKNLRLFRKPHRTKKRKSNNGIYTATATATVKATAAEQLSSMKGYPCTFGSCQKIYAKPAHLKAHLRRHFGEKPYICTWPECTWKFSRSDELARHRRSHSGVKPYKCDYCSKCFARSDHLAKHRKVHERRLLAASKAGGANNELPSSVFNVRPGRKRKNQIC